MKKHVHAHESVTIRGNITAKRYRNDVIRSFLFSS